MTFWDHLEALRVTLLRMGVVIFLATLLAFFFHKPLFALLLAPVEKQLPNGLYFFSPTEGFVTVLKVAFWSGFLLSSPLWLLFLVRFITPALRLRERAILLPFLGLSTLFVSGGILFAYTVTLPLVSRFFLKFNAQLGENLWGVGETLNFSLGLILAHGLVFELYVGLLFLIRFGLVTASQLIIARRGVIVLIVFLAAVLTPPDVLSQLLLAVPMVLMYETAVFYAKRRSRYCVNT